MGRSKEIFNKWREAQEFPVKDSEPKAKFEAIVVDHFAGKRYSAGTGTDRERTWIIGHRFVERNKLDAADIIVQPLESETPKKQKDHVSS